MKVFRAALDAAARIAGTISDDELLPLRDDRDVVGLAAEHILDRRNLSRSKRSGVTPHKDVIVDAR